MVDIQISLDLNFYICDFNFDRYGGQVGYLIAQMRSVTDVWIGDTLYREKSPVEPLPGFKPAKPMVTLLVFVLMAIILILWNKTCFTFKNF